MARRRYYRRAIRVVPKKKWATNFKTITCSSSTTAGKYEILAENKAQAGSPTPTIVKCGNFKVQGDCSVANTASVLGILYLRVFVLYVPEGWSVSNISQIPEQHPEWIMAWSAVDLPTSAANTTSGGNKFSVSSRLKRNLNSGDMIVFYMDPTYDSDTSPLISVLGAAQFWTCAN